ncbi:unnamed protein product [Linum tenue]|uniref:Non-specific lipid-transfer protein n=1 Tax=Linum tenue TaxID=586396 RepID=A0AAV0KSB4_9ROSI|nr:unnamed protein product [Linum tenue]
MAGAAAKMVSMVLVCALVAAPYMASVDAITCGQVTSSLAPCLGYLTKGGTVPPACCNGVKSLNGAAQTTPDRQAACECLKSAAGSVSFDPKNAAGLPAACGVNIPYKFSTSTNCKSVK